MARFRLRFLLQEFDLPRGPTLIGRSSECHVTIEDPLVSRQHARIDVEGDEVILTDLGSRNGLKLNGTQLKGLQTLKDGDRIRIGTQDLVFCRVEVTHSSTKTTGFLRHCARCGLPYPQEAAVCPNCGCTEQVDEETMSGQFNASAQGAWNLQLYVEVVERAVALGRFEDAVRLLRRATTHVEERLAAGDVPQPDVLAPVTVIALRTAIGAGVVVWAEWVSQTYRRLGQVPPEATLALFAEATEKFPEFRESIATLTAHLRTRAESSAFTDAERSALSQLERLSGAFLPAGTPPRGLPRVTS